MRSTLSGWGLSPNCLTCVVDVAQIDFSKPNTLPETLIPRGLGRGYGDCAINGAGFTATTGSLNNFSLDGSILITEAGVSIDEILQQIVPLGFFIPVTPGTKFVTVGGAIASDVHGKNHHKDGSFGNFVKELDLQIADGTVQKISPYINPSLFWATIGGMGLTGLILRAKIQLEPIETSKIMSTNIVCSSLDELMVQMIKADELAKYSVAWVDTLATGKKLGRSVLSIGEHATRNDLSKILQNAPLSYSPKQLIGFPEIRVNGLLNRFSVRIFNLCWYQKAKLSKKNKVVSLDTFFYPLDLVRDWNRMYGESGFIQYQISIPDSGSHVIKEVLEKFSERQIPSFLSVLKRFGPQGSGLLSFPSNGWTLAVDIPSGVDGLGELLDELDEIVVNQGGRVYFAKDSRMNPKFVERMYPQLKEFRKVKNQVDPENVFQSNLSRRLGL